MNKETIFGVGFWIVLMSGIILWNVLRTDTPKVQHKLDIGPKYDYEEPITSENWDCTSDCSGHDAGYEWAEDNGITDPDDCGGNSDSFIEGCEAYANEYQIENEYYDE